MVFVNLFSNLRFLVFKLIREPMWRRY